MKSLPETYFHPRIARALVATGAKRMSAFDARARFRFEQYDRAVKVDGLVLLHDDFFDHLVLLPGVRLQNGNPARETRTGDGVNYRVEYRYTYDDARRPLTKTGEATVTNGSDAGRRFETSAESTYY